MSSQRTQEELGEIMSRSNQAVSQEKGVRSTRGMVVLNFSLDQYHNQYVFGHVSKWHDHLLSIINIILDL